MTAIDGNEWEGLWLWITLLIDVSVVIIGRKFKFWRKNIQQNSDGIEGTYIRIIAEHALEKCPATPRHPDPRFLFVCRRIEGPLIKFTSAPPIVDDKFIFGPKIELFPRG